MTAPSTYQAGDVPGLGLLDPTIAHILRVALADFRVPTAARARIMDFIGRAAAEIDEALKLAAVGRVKEVA